ncbi:MAG: metal ABC transporter permease [bacterium]|nr:metal ABC transporter permease [bacterium]
MSLFFDAFNYTFMRNALIGGVLISFCAGLLGVSLVLKRFSMIGDGLSHVGFGALAIGAAAGIAPLKVAIPIVIIAAVLLLRINESSKINGDAAIALVSTASLAVGIFVASLTGGMNIDLNNYMFGSILAMKTEYVVICAVISLLTAVLYFMMYNRIFATAFDETFARATGIRTSLFTTLIAVMTAVITVVGMQMMGALLMSSFIVFPALTTMRICKSFKFTVISSSLLAILSFLTGLFISFVLNTPAGATVVIVDLVIYLFVTLSVKLIKRA